MPAKKAMRRSKAVWTWLFLLTQDFSGVDLDSLQRFKRSLQAPDKVRRIIERRRKGELGALRRLCYRGYSVGGKGFILVCSAWLCLTAGCSRSQSQLFARPEVKELRRGHFLKVDSETPPAFSEAWQAVSLPDLWRISRPNQGGSGWYRFVLPGLIADSVNYSIHLPKLNMNAAVYINGHWVGDGGSFEPPVAQNWNRPLYYSFPSSLLSPEKNVVEVRLYAYAHDWGGLYPLYLGPHLELIERAEKQYFWQITVSQIASLLVLMLTLALAVMAVGNQDAVYRYWALGCGLYFLHSLSPHVRDIESSYQVGRWMIHASFDLFALFLVLGIHRWARVKKPWLEIAMVASIAGGAVLTYFLPNSLFMPVANALHLIPLVLGAYSLAVLVRYFASLGGPEAGLTIFAGVLALLLGVHALMIYFGFLPQDEPRLLKLIAPVLMMGFGGVLAGRYVRAANEAKALNLELGQRVAERETELKKQFDRLRKMEGEQVLAQERSRLMKEMHDGMGGRLISLLSLVEGGKPSRELLMGTLKDAVEEMRFIIDSLDPDIDDLGILLGLLRERTEPRLRGQGLKLVWKVGRLPESLVLTPEQSLDILRIVQECFTNILKHAGATEVELGTELSEESVSLYVKDNGMGLDSSTKRGRGLQNMRSRAQRLGGDLEVLSDEGGVCIKLGIPHPEAP